MTVYWQFDWYYMTLGLHCHRGRYYSNGELFQTSYVLEIGFGPLILNIIKEVEH